MSDTHHLLTDSEAGELLRMLPVRVVRLAKRGVIPHVALPDGELRFVAADLLNWAMTYRRPAPSGECAAEAAR